MRLWIPPGLGAGLNSRADAAATRACERAALMPAQAPAVLGFVSTEDESANFARAWNACLQLAQSFPQCWDYVDAAASICPDVCEFVARGAPGACESSCRAMVPWLSVLPWANAQFDFGGEQSENAMYAPCFCWERHESGSERQ